MGKYVKWIGAGLGWALGGPIGGVLGFAFGSIWDDKSLSKEDQTHEGHRIHGDDNYRRQYQNHRHQTQGGDFASALIILSAAVMKADGKHLRSELNYIRQFFEKNFGPAVAAEQIGILKELLVKDIPLHQVCEQIRYFMEHSMRLQMLHYLFGIAKADGHVDKLEEDTIAKIARALGISDKDYASIQAMFYKNGEHAYTILEIEKDASDAEVKKAYRKMALKYHPDKISDLGEAYQSAAKEKFIKVQEAYESIKKERNFK